ncbi:MAG: MBL fold metallo-hydrolase [Parcubacteria group bacterium]
MKQGLLIFLLAVSNVLILLSVVKDDADASISFFDVGQGDGSLIRLGKVDVLIDAGPGKSVLYGLENVIPKTDKYIDLVVISHPHADHYGGLEDVLSNYSIGAIVWNGSSEDERFNAIIEKAGERGIQIINLFAGSAIRTERLDMKVIYPPREADKLLSGNNSSLVIFTEAGELTGLFTGDIERNAESAISAILFPEVDFLKVPHHGSSVSSSYGFLSALNPAVAVISVGQNSYGLPNSATLERLASFNIPVFRTDKLGSIKLVKKNEKLYVKSLE